MVETFDKSFLTWKRFTATLKLIKSCPRYGFALDIGCGRSPYLFHGYVYNYIGLDIDIKTLTKVSQDLRDVSLIRASGLRVPFKSNSFTLVICTETIEHLKEPERMISEISRVLVKGGFGVVSVPSLSLPQILILWIAYKTGKISKHPYQSLDHKREYAKFKVTPHFEKIESLFKLFKENGLQIRDILTVESLYMRPKNIYDAFLSKIEPLTNKVLSKFGIGHYTIFRVQKA